MSLDEKRKQYEKWTRRMVADPTGLQVIGDSIGLKLTQEALLPGSPIVAVLVPSYDGLKHQMADSSSRMVRYSQQFCTVFSEPVKSSSVISWVRNDMVADLYKSKKKFTHILFIDDDMVVEKDALVRLLRAEADIIGGVYTVRTDPPIPNLHAVNLATGEAHRCMKWPEGEILVSNDKGKSLTVGTGFLLIKREVLDRVAQFYINCEYEKLMWNLTEEQIQSIRDKRRLGYELSKNGYWFQFLPRLMGSAESGEDTSFCIKAAMCGFKIQVDSSLKLGHVGEYVYSLDDYVQFRDESVAAAKADGSYHELGPKDKRE